MRRSTVLVLGLALVAVASTGCRTARVGSRCSAAEGAARNDTHVLFCVKGRWKATLTIGQAADIVLAGVPVRVEVQGAVISPRVAVAGEPITGMGVRVLDHKGVGVAGTDVVFTGLGSSVVTTDAAGVAALPTSIVTRIAGDTVVTASAAGLQPVRLPIRIVPAAPDRTYRSDNLTQTVALGDAIAPITIVVVDQYGNPVPGVSAVGMVAGVDARLIDGFSVVEAKGEFTITTKPLEATGTATFPLRIYEPTHTNVFTEIELSWTVV